MGGGCGGGRGECHRDKREGEERKLRWEKKEAEILILGDLGQSGWRKKEQQRSTEWQSGQGWCERRNSRAVTAQSRGGTKRQRERERRKKEIGR